MSKAFREKGEGGGLYTATYISANDSAGKTHSTIGKGQSHGNYVNVDPVRKIHDGTDEPPFLFPKSFPD